MKEDFLHYIWQYKKFDFANLKTVSNKLLTVSNVGQYTQLAGPDFFNAQIIIGNQKWAGNVEIHVKSSDWYLHKHEKDANYDTVILHVVWEFDSPVFNSNNQEIEVLEIKNYVSDIEYKKYLNLTIPKTWIYCENFIQNTESFVWNNWQERLFLERLQRKTKAISDLLETSNSDWESVLFYQLAKNFGLNTNGDSFFQIATSISFATIRKESLDNLYLEALLFGQGNLIPSNPEDQYSKELKSWYDYLILKYKIEPLNHIQLQFFKHRPDNFPTIRLAQLASIYAKNKNVFATILNFTKKEEYYLFFETSISDYWLNHYQLDKPSIVKSKKISKSFIDLLIINTIIPIIFAYNQSIGKDLAEDVINLIQSLKGEKNGIIDKFKNLKIATENAFQTQSLLQLKLEYCDNKKCLQCAVGLDFLKNN